MDPIQILGLFAGVITSAGMIPQLLKTYKTKEAEELSFKMFVIYMVGFSLWITYGFLKSDIPIVATNFVSIGLNTTLLVMKIKYGKGGK